MARNACYAAKQVLFERDMAQQRYMPISPVALTGSQERAERGGSKGWKVADAKMWKLRARNPSLFANIDKHRAGESSHHFEDGFTGPVGILAGFDKVVGPGGEARQGWLMHKEEAYYLEMATDRLLWLDSSNAAYRELAVGDDLHSSGRLSISAAAAIAAPSSSGASRPSGGGTGPSPAGGASSSRGAPSRPSPARHLVITDLHKVADVYNLQLGHLDRPAVMLAAYGTCPGSAPPDAAVKGLHERLLRRLSGFRGHWPDEALEAALAESLAAIGSESAGSSPSGASAGVAGAVAVLFGPRLVTATTHGSCCCLVDVDPGSDGDLRIVSESAEGATQIATATTSLSVREAGSTVILLQSAAVARESALSAAKLAATGRCRAGATALLQSTLSSASCSPARTLAAACARLAWYAGGGGAAEGGGERPQKRPRNGDSSMEGEQVRYRQILLKYVGCKAATDPVRRKPVRRSQGEAEAAMLGVLQALQEKEAAEGAAAASRLFTERCRALSECQSSLRGGELAGDVGWQRYPAAAKPGEKIPKDVASRHAVIKAAFDLEVGEVSDVLISDDGVHLLKRSA